MKLPLEIQEMINSRFNCVLRHHICPGGKMSHTGGTGGEEVWKKCLDNLIEWEGIEAIEKYLQSMVERTQTIGLDVLHRFYGYHPELKEKYDQYLRDKWDSISEYRD
jgi:hypothetical protein